MDKTCSAFTEVVLVSYPEVLLGLLFSFYFNYYFFLFPKVYKQICSALLTLEYG